MILGPWPDGVATAQVQGRAPDPYTVELDLGLVPGDGPDAECSCPAAAYRRTFLRASQTTMSMVMNIPGLRSGESSPFRYVRRFEGDSTP